MEATIQPSDITLITAYSNDYTVGKLCASVNRCYAESKGYRFLCEEFDCDEVSSLIAPKLHFTWYKIYLLIAVLKRLIEESVGEFRYLMWVDADAIVVNCRQSVECIIQDANYRELIIAEDMHVGNLLNAGIFLLRVCDWSVKFLEDVYAITKYDTVPFYEQSAMISTLKRYKERFLCYPPKPFHSYISGCLGVKVCQHVAIFPTCRLNSNEGVDAADLDRYGKAGGSHSVPNRFVETVELTGGKVPIFIYHAAGLRNKLAYIKAAIYKFNVMYDKSSVDIDTMVFAPIRNNLGHYRKDILELHKKYPRKQRGSDKERGLRTQGDNVVISGDDDVESSATGAVGGLLGESDEGNS